MSSGGIVLASLAAYLIGELSYSMLHSKMKVLLKGRLLWVRSIGSSVVGQLLDSVIFIFIASLVGVFGWEVFAALVLTNYLLKLCMEVIVTPFTYLFVGLLKKSEGIDVYDEGIKYRMI
jgi:uncharacterized integral membrane protein (TIGR00697 family)